MRCLFAALICLLSIHSLAQQAAPAVELKSVAGMVILDQKLFVADPQSGRIWFRKIADKDFHVFVEDKQFKKPSGLAADEYALYVSDPEARSIFRVDKVTREVTLVWKSDSRVSPTDIAFIPSYTIENQQIKRTNELVILDEDGKMTYRLKLAGDQTELRPWKVEGLAEPTSLFRSGQRVLLADRGAKTIFESTGTRGLSNLLREEIAESLSLPGFFSQNWRALEASPMLARSITL
jgi:hypothetical protein